MHNIGIVSDPIGILTRACSAPIYHEKEDRVEYAIYIRSSQELWICSHPAQFPSGPEFQIVIHRSRRITEYELECISKTYFCTTGHRLTVVRK